MPTVHRLNTTANLSVVANHAHLFMTTVYLLMVASSRIAKLMSDWFFKHDSESWESNDLYSLPDLNPREHLWDVVEWEIPIMDA